MKHTLSHSQDFLSIFNQPCEVTCSAPGRVNLMGDHTDYNGGLVLPAAISLRTYVELSSRKDDMVEVWSHERSQTGLESFRLGDESPRGNWIDYIQGITYILRKNHHPSGGFNLRISSDIPLGSGLSSSAALEVSILKGLRELYQLPLDDLAIAILGQQVENSFVGAPVGIMDQMAVSLGDVHTALLIDTKTLAYEKIPIPSNIEIIIINSGISHHHATGGYKERRMECDLAAGLLNTKYLVDLPLTSEDLINKLPSPLNNRVKHVIRESNRVIETANALKKEDFKALKRLFYESHDSLRDDYAVSVPQIDTLIEMAKKEDDIIGARLTGGGFGGAIVLLAYQGKGKEAASRVIQNSIKKVHFSPYMISS